MVIRTRGTNYSMYIEDKNKISRRRTIKQIKPKKEREDEVIGTTWNV